MFCMFYMVKLKEEAPARLSGRAPSLLTNQQGLVEQRGAYCGFAAVVAKLDVGGGNLH